jgi:hypothetical protein
MSRFFSDSLEPAIGHGQALAAFRTTAFQHKASATGFHTGAEAVLVVPFAIMWLVGALHP